MNERASSLVLEAEQGEAAPVAAEPLEDAAAEGPEVPVTTPPRTARRRYDARSDENPLEVPPLGCPPHLKAQIETLKLARNALRDERKKNRNDLRNAMRKKRHLTKTASQLSNNDLMEVFVLRRQAQEERLKAASASSSASTSSSSGMSMSPGSANSALES